TRTLAQNNLMKEIQRMGGRDPVLSTNIKLRIDGLPYASQRPPEDPGVAVYFTYKKQPMVFACDRWDLVQDNIHAIVKTIEALRGIERWGASDMLERAFSGFAALPSPDQMQAETWRDVLQMGNRLPHETDHDVLQEAERNYKLLRSQYHPDRGGSAVAFQTVNEAIEQARRELAR
ncbi:MAG: J domain-containing protein, partial [Gammaproteobacteria bacterium]|nr:J domain-containing protein [Gammaproteobacteria bacterium]